MCVATESGALPETFSAQGGGRNMFGAGSVVLYDADVSRLHVGYQGYFL